MTAELSNAAVLGEKMSVSRQTQSCPWVWVDPRVGLGGVASRFLSFQFVGLGPL